MKVGVMLPVGRGSDGTAASWAEIRELAVAAEEAGLDSVWFADHLFHRPGDGSTSPMHEAWTLLSATAAVTERVQLGTMVLCASFRDPGLTAKLAVTADAVSGGRVILGVGAGWHDPEYEAFGLPTDHRVGRFEEWLEILVRLLRSETVTFDGTYHRVSDAVLAPAPNRRIPVLIAGNRPRMLRLTARWADQWNTAWFGALDDQVEARLAAFEAAVQAEGRPAGAVLTTVGMSVVDPDHVDPKDHSDSAFAGSIEELATAISAYEERGVGHLVVGLDPQNLASLNRLSQARRLSEDRPRP